MELLFDLGGDGGEPVEQGVDGVVEPAYPVGPVPQRHSSPGKLGGDPFGGGAYHLGAVVKLRSSNPIPRSSSRLERLGGQSLLVSSLISQPQQLAGAVFQVGWAGRVVVERRGHVTPPHGDISSPLRIVDRQHNP